MSAQMIRLVDVSTVLKNKWVGRAIDLAVVLGILGLSVDWAPGTVAAHLQLAQTKTAQLDESALANAIDQFSLANGRLPQSFAVLLPRFLREVHKDPWGHDYVLEIKGSSYAVISQGTAQRLDGSDAIVTRGTLRAGQQCAAPAGTP